MDYKKLNKKAMACMYVKTAIVNIIWSIGLVVGSIVLKEEIPAIATGILYGLVVILVLYALVAPKIRYESYRYRLTEEEFAVRKGLFILTTEIVPIERLHKIEVSSGPVFRAFGMKEIKVTTAGGEINVSYLDNEVADRIAEHLKKRINTIAAEERNAELEEKMQENADTQNVATSETNVEGEHGGE